MQYARHHEMTNDLRMAHQMRELRKLLDRIDYAIIIMDTEYKKQILQEIVHEKLYELKRLAATDYKILDACRFIMANSGRNNKMIVDQLHSLRKVLTHKFVLDNKHSFAPLFGSRF